LLLLLWYWLPHPFWDRNPAKNSEREARLWAHVLSQRVGGQRSGALLYTTMLPTLGLLWAEATGHRSYRATWMCVSGGEQYDKLGLIEALRRGASHIVVLDASGDQADTWSSLGHAIALARVETGVSIDLDPTAMVSGDHPLAPGEVVRPWAYGRFMRPESITGSAEIGEIWICKLGWWNGAPFDVLAYAKGHPGYPSGGSPEQLRDAREFEAYRELGAATVLAAAQQGTPPLRWEATPAKAIQPK
jgi:hypothetical protein